VHVVIMYPLLWVFRYPSTSHDRFRQVRAGI